MQFLSVSPGEPYETRTPEIAHRIPACAATPFWGAPHDRSSDFIRQEVDKKRGKLTIALGLFPHPSSKKETPIPFP